MSMQDFSSEAVYNSFRMYQALKLHFTSKSYNAVKYNYKTSVTPKGFFKRKDKYKYNYAIKHHSDDVKGFYTYNFIEGVNWVGDMTTDNYDKHRKVHDALTYTFREDMDLLSNRNIDLGSWLDCKESEVMGKWGKKIVVPEILKVSDISIESIVILNKLTGFVNRSEASLSKHATFKNLGFRIKRYADLMDITDISKYKNVVLNTFE
jgi:hypothetical protein